MLYVFSGGNGIERNVQFEILGSKLFLDVTADETKANSVK